LSHAIEDIALDEANGTLLSARILSIELHRERHCQLAATIDRVQHSPPAASPSPPDASSSCARVRPVKAVLIVLYAGGSKSALLLCQEVRSARDWDDKSRFIPSIGK
jgi:hypothetical protein